LRDPVESAPDREATPCEEVLAGTGAIPPRTGLDGLEDARPVRAGFGAEDTGRGPALVAVFGQIGAGVGANVVLFVRLVEFGDQADRVVENLDDVGECVAEETRDPHRDVDAWTAELSEVDDFQAADATGRGVPRRTHTEQCEHFGDVGAGGAHRGGTPDGQAHRTRILTGLLAVPRE